MNPAVFYYSKSMPFKYPDDKPYDVYLSFCMQVVKWFYNLDTYVLKFLGSRDGSMGLWEVTEEVMSQAERSQNEESVPSYAHISHRALKDIPKEYTNPYNCKVRALAFNNNHKVRFILMQHLGKPRGCIVGEILSTSLNTSGANFKENSV